MYEAISYTVCKVNSSNYREGFVSELCTERPQQDDGDDGVFHKLQQPYCHHNAWPCTAHCKYWSIS